MKPAVWIAMLLLFFAAACVRETRTTGPGTAAVIEDPDFSKLKSIRVAMETRFGNNGGTIELELYPDLAPDTVENFLMHIRRGTYRGSSFHRVANSFMIQGGKPANKKQKFQTIDAEFGKMRHRRGVLSMARGPDPDSATCEFFIVHQDQNFLNGNYAAFGRVVRGMDVVDRIANLPTRPNPTVPGAEMSLPTVPITIVDIKVVGETNGSNR